MEKKKGIIAVIVVFSLLTGSYWAWRNYYQVEPQGIEATGTIEATSVNLTARLAGTIKTLNIKAGDKVHQGQLVAELNRNDLVAQWERDRLSVVKAQALLADLQSGARQQKLKEAEATVNIARANYQKAVDDLARLEILLKEKAVSQAVYDQARTALEINANQLQAAEARFSLLQAGNRPEAINAARLEVERNKAILAATEAMLDDLKIYSPIDGVVLARNYEPGEYVTAGAAIATVVNMDDLWIRVYIPTDDLPRVVLGQQVTFTVSGLDRSFTGVVEEIATKGEFTPKTIQTKKERTNVVFAVKIRINSEGGILKPGMPADVVFSGGGQDD